MARFLVETSYNDPPGAVRDEGPRTFLNWLGCVYGGLHDPASDTAYTALGECAGSGDATIIGRKRRADPVSATFFNTLSSCTHGYDDAHLATVAHPGGPAAAAALAAAEMVDATGHDLLNAILLGVELQCRISLALAAEPGRASLGFTMTGLTGALGAAAAAGKLLGLDEQRTCWALGIAAAQGAGFRETHASMSNGLIRAQAARNGITAALLARSGFTCTETALEGAKGFVAVFASRANVDVATSGLGEHYELLNNTYKPYPCGIPINPIIDACLEIAKQVEQDQIETVDLFVNPLALELTGRRNPSDVEEARVSLFHWAAAALVRGHAGLAEIEEECVKDPIVVDLRGRISAQIDDAQPRDGARARVLLKDRRILSADIAHSRGSVLRPLTNEELEVKFVGQARGVVNEGAIQPLIDACWALASSARLSTRQLLHLLR
jgi:2-methylcitrate dehydratase PrpD